MTPDKHNLQKSDIAKKEEEILEFWRREKIFEQTLAKPAPKGEFVFYEGPPTANGRPGIHHLEARAFKDVIPRFRTMQGYHVRRKAGWDTHGLPVELEVEKELGLKTKKEIEDYGLAEFNRRCRASVWKYLQEWEQFTERIGFWVDQANPYVTYHNSYIESVWWVLSQVAERGLLYRDYKVLPWCPRCGTALSSHEVAQGYKEVEDPAVYVKFKVKNPEARDLPPNTYLVAWTTTPWTLPGNVALAVGKGIEYALVEHDDEHLIASREFTFLAPSDVAQSGVASRLVRQIPATQLVGLEYEPLFDFPQLQNDKSHRVYAADFVTTDEGTGIVHTAVMYGADDFTLGQKVGLPKVHLVAEDGKFVDGTPWAGRFVKNVDGDIITDLDKRGLLLRQEKCLHSYPFCWRCKTPLLYYARASWYIRMSALRDELLTENEKINWEPDHFKHGRFGEWLTEVKDWAISRERYWGTPLPFWLPADDDSSNAAPVVVDSLEELKKRVKRSGNRYLVMRHGEAENNTANILSSRADNPHHLTKRGCEQVAAAAKNLKQEKIDLIVSSDFVRTRETAELVLKALGLPNDRLSIDQRLGEVNHGELDRQPVNVYHKIFKTKEEYFIKPLPGGESFNDVKRRTGDALYDLERRYQGKTILIVTHESPAWLLLAAASGLNIEESIILRGEGDDFIANAEVKSFDFVPLPHNENYELDLHRPFIDEISLVDDAGRELKRAPEVLDVWFDSGAMPWAEDGYPAAIAEPLYPADYIAEAVDQTRGWFYTLLAIGILLGKGSPYRNVIVLGHLLDKEGKKMSKSVGNVVEPNAMIDRYGADSLRYFMYTVNSPGESKNFDERLVDEAVKKVRNPLANVVSFYQLYVADLLTKNGGKSVAAAKKLTPLDQWLLAYRRSLVASITRDLENYKITEAARRLRDFVADLSQWYLRRSRDRLRAGSVETRRKAGELLRETLEELAKLFAPFTPFLAEEVYQAVRVADGPISVHLTDWPRVEVQTGDEQTLETMRAARRLVSFGFEARERAGVRVRQPLAKITFRESPPPLVAEPDWLAIIAEELNVRTVAFNTKLSESVVLDTELTDELRDEGRLREIVRAIQPERKVLGLKPGQLVSATLTASKEFLETARRYENKLKTLASLSSLTYQEGAELRVRLAKPAR